MDGLALNTRSKKVGGVAMSTPFYQMEHAARKERLDVRQSSDEVGQTPSGPKGDNPGTAGPGKTDVKSKTPENAKGHINPSAPEDANVTPGSIEQK